MVRRDTGNGLGIKKLIWSTFQVDARELNEACAKKLGFEWSIGNKDVSDHWCQRDKTGQCIMRTPELPNYVGSIHAAFEIVKHISKRLDPNGPLEETHHPDGRHRFVGHGFRLEHHTENTGEKWVCTLPEIVCAPPYEEMNANISEEAETAPEAIVRAFLKLP